MAGVMLGKFIRRVAATLLVTVVAVAAIYFGLRLYSEPAQQALMDLFKEQRVLSKDLTRYVLDISHADYSAMQEVSRSEGRMDGLMERLRDRQDNKAMLILLAVPADELTAVLGLWEKLKGRIDDVLVHQDAFERLQAHVTRFDESVGSVLSNSEEIGRMLVAEGATPRQVYLASRQLMLIQRIANNIHDILRGLPPGLKLSESPQYEAIVNDAAVFEEALDTLLKGNAVLGLTNIRDDDAEHRLQRAAASFRRISEEIGRIVETVPALFEAQNKAESVYTVSREFDHNSAALMDAFIENQERRNVIFIGVYSVGITVLLVLFLYAFRAFRDYRQRLEYSTAQNTRYKVALSQIKTSVERLARGESTGKALDVGGESEGLLVSLNEALARWRQFLESVNKNTAALLPLISGMNTTLEQMIQANNKQIESTAEGSAKLNELAPTLEHLSRQAADSAQVIERLKGHCSDAQIRLNEADIQTGHIRAQMHNQEAYAPLMNSLQGLSDKVASLGEATEQLSVLVLHLLIRAHGIGPVQQDPGPHANKALQLAHQCTESTDQLQQGLEQLRGELQQLMRDQQHVGEAVSALLHAAEQVDGNLENIGKIAGQLEATLHGLPQSLKDQAAAVVSISDDMESIHSYTMQSSQGTTDVSSSIGDALELIRQIRIISGKDGKAK